MTIKKAYNLFEKTIEKSGVEITFELSNARATLIQSLDRLQELEKLHKPTRLEVKIDKDGRTIWCCPKCHKIMVKFWSEVETISPRNYCFNCGQRLDWETYGQ